MGAIRENATISNIPTFMCKDASATPFVITLRLPSESAAFDASPLKEGHTILVFDAKKSPMKDDRFIIKADPEDVKVIPGSMQKLFEMSAKSSTINDFRAKLNKVWNPATPMDTCHACEHWAEGKLKCKGCGEVSYCNKECQKRGWNRKDHKSECKIYKAVAQLS